MIILDGRGLAKAIVAEARRTVGALERKPQLAVMLVGSDPASHLYVNLKKKRAEYVGIPAHVELFFATATQQELLNTIHAWNENPDVSGILVQLPLPESISTDSITTAIDPKKDVDGFHPSNIALLLANDPSAFVPPVHSAVLSLIRASGKTLRGLTAVIIGNSRTFTEPLKHLLDSAGIQTRIVIGNDRDHVVTFTEDIVIVAIGSPAWLTPDKVTDGAIVIDIGTNRFDNDIVVGDVDTRAFEQKAGWISPVPGGVGPLTVAHLLKNVVQAATLNRS